MMILSAASNAQRRVCVAFDATRSVALEDRRELYRRRWRAVSSSFLLNSILRTVFNSYLLMPYSSGPYLLPNQLSRFSLSLVSTRMTRWTLSITSPSPWATTTTSCSPHLFLSTFFSFFFIGRVFFFCFVYVFLANIDQVSSISVYIQFTEL